MKLVNYILSTFLLFCFIFSSCKVGKKYERPKMEDMPQRFDSLYHTDSFAVSDIGWRTLYQDTVLQQLIGRALDNNKDMRIAAARIKEMIARKRISFANLFPEVGVELSGQREYLNYGGHKESFDPKIKGNLNFSWELDIWGKLRWANEAGVAEYLQSVETQRGLYLTIVAEVAQTYFELKALDSKLAIVKQTLEARQEGVHFAKLRFDGGLTSEIPYRQSVVELARTETLVPDLQNEIKLKENDLAILLGEFPSTVIPRGKDLNQQPIPDNLPVDLPSSLLERRPDVRKAEQGLIAANAEVGVALTEMFPSFGLTAHIGGRNDQFKNFLESPTWFISGLVTGPIFNMGKNKAKHKAAQAAYEQTVLDYEKKILDVFKEVNNAINTFEKTKEMRKSQETLYLSAQSYHKLARLQYVNGIINYIDVLDAQRQLFDAEIALNESILQELLSVVSLYKALGGGLEK